MAQSKDSRQCRIDFSTASFSTSRVRVFENEDGTLTKSCVSDDLPIKCRTDAVLQGLHEVLLHHDCSVADENEIFSQISQYLNSCQYEDNAEKVWLARCKYLLCLPMSKYLRNQCPPSPDEQFEFCGRARRWYKARVNAFNRRNTHLWYSWLQARRAALPVSESEVRRAYDDHLSTLTGEDPGDPFYIDAIFRCEAFVDVLDGLSQEFRSDAPVFVDPHRQASYNACWEKSRGSGGAAAVLRDSFVRRQGSPLCGRAFSGMFWSPRAFYQKEWCFSTCFSVYMDDDLTAWSKHVNTTWNTILGDADKPSLAMIQAVLEPLKIRIISKGPAELYYCVSRAQRVMHDFLRKRPQFRLVGRTVCPTDLLDLWQDDDQPDWEWMSIDYQKSTDLLSWRYSSRILDRILAGCHPDVRRQIFRALAPHELYYPDDTMEERRLGGLQTNGQLMGSIISFPILCLANYGVYCLMAKCQSVKYTNWDFSKVLVNGDDMLYRGPPGSWDQHIRIGEKVGLKMSIGKAYRHGVYANINSMSFHCKSPTDVYQIGYLASGLLLDRHKVQSRGGTAAAHVLGQGLGTGALAHLVVEGARTGAQNHALSRFILHHRTILEKESLSATVYPRSWFLPVSVGGLGLPVLPNRHVRLTKEQRRAATRCLLGDIPRRDTLYDGYWRRFHFGSDRCNHFNYFDVRPTRGLEPREVLTHPSFPCSEKKDEDDRRPSLPSRVFLPKSYLMQHYVMSYKCRFEYVL